MLKYAKITDPEKGTCQVGTGDPNAFYKTVTDEETGEQKTLYVSDFYQSLGMEEMEVEQGYDDKWYVVGKAPAPPETKTIRTFSKFKIWVVTRDMNITLEDGTQTTVWAAFEAFLNEAGLWTGYNQLVDLVDDNEFFIQMYPAAVERFGAELVDQVLAASVVATQEVIVE